MTTGAATTGSSGGNQLVSDITGWIDQTSNTFGIQGGFAGLADSLGANALPPGDCQNDGFKIDQCSSITLTISAPGRICASGTVGMLIADATGTLASAALWGAAVGLDLNDRGGYPDASVRSAYAADVHGVTGFGFDIDQVPVGGVRVEFPAAGQEVKPRYVTITGAGHHDLRFSDASVGYDPTDTAVVNQSAVDAIRWHVPGSTTERVPFVFCLSGLAVLTN